MALLVATKSETSRWVSLWAGTSAARSMADISNDYGPQNVKLI